MFQMTMFQLQMRGEFCMCEILFLLKSCWNVVTQSLVLYLSNSHLAQCSSCTSRNYFYICHSLNSWLEFSFYSF